MFVSCIGDSLTQFGIRTNGWISLLNSWYEREIQFLSFGYSGYNTKWILENLKDILEIPTPVYIIWLGTNDCCKDTSQFVSVANFKNNMALIINQIKAFATDPIIIVLSPVPNERFERSTASDYAKQIADLTRTLDFVFVDLFKLSWSTDDYSDGLHLSDKGNFKIFRLLKEQVIPTEIKYNRQLQDWKDL